MQLFVVDRSDPWDEVDKAAHTASGQDLLVSFGLGREPETRSRIIDVCSPRRTVLEAKNTDVAKHLARFYNNDPSTYQ